MMIENTKNEISLELNRVERKVWREPQMTQLNVKETKGGRNEWNFETPDWVPDFFSSHS